MIFRKSQSDASAASPAAKPTPGAAEATVLPVPAPSHARLAPTELRRHVDPARLRFSSTADLEPADGLIGQERALKALELGVGIRQRGFNVFVLGTGAAGKATAVRSFLQTKARGAKLPPEWVYVNNFENPLKPKAISLPAGQARELARGMVKAIDELRSAVPAIFESEEAQARRRAIEEAARMQQEQAFEGLNQRAMAQGIALLKTPMGFAFAPVQDGKVIKPELYSTLSDAARADIESKVQGLQKELEAILEQVPKWERERRNGLKTLGEEVAEIAVRQALAEIKSTFSALPDVASHLEATHRDLVSNVGIFLGVQGEEGEGVRPGTDTSRDPRFRRWLVNVVVEHEPDLAGAPIIEEINPTHANLLGRIEHIAQMGTLVTDFLLIKSGALHRANGGYLLIDARNMLLSPFAWEALKRALQAGVIRLETPAEMVGMIATQSLDADPIPLDVRVILLGDRELYYLLSAYDPDFLRLFKVQADFDDTIDSSPENDLSFARLIASIVRENELKPVDAGGVARLIEEGSRLADDNRKLSVEAGRIADIVKEADFYATGAGRAMITRQDISRAVNEGIQRADRLRDKAAESIDRGIVLVDTKGSAVGQINGLSVLSLGNFAFGRPSRITARVRLGAGRVLDIEREVNLGGPLHSKGVMILWGFLAGRFAQDVPLAMAASLVFEQSYGGVDGDSASSAELYALLSALSGVPIKQGLAVTGSVNQYGQVQAIGGVNEKIEGFFDVCKARGLTGEQGVLIPASNAQHLMLRDEVVEAARAGTFHIYPVTTIDQGIEILTGVAAGERGADGNFPAGTVNGMVEARLQQLAAMRRSFAEQDNADGAGKSGNGKAVS